MKRAVIGIVDTLGQADAMVRELRFAGFFASDISVLLPSTQGTKDFAHEHNTKAPEGAIAGVGAGGLVGGAIGLLAGIGALAIPGVGPLIAAGPLMATLSGAAAGATVGGIAGALVGMGVPELEAKLYEGKIRGGNFLVAVHTEDADKRSAAIQIFRGVGAHDVSTLAEAAAPAQGTAQ